MSQIVRVLADPTVEPCRRGLDARTGRKIEFFRGSDIGLQIALAQDGEHVTSANAATLRIELKDKFACAGDPSLWAEEISAFDPDHTAATWSAGTTSLATATIPRDITRRLIPGEYWLIIHATEGTKTIYFAEKIHVRRSHTDSIETYNFAAGGVIATGTVVSTTASAPITAGANTVTVNVPATFSAADYTSHVVTGGPDIVELSSTVTLGGATITFQVTTSPAANGTHTLDVNFLKVV